MASAAIRPPPLPPCGSWLRPVGHIRFGYCYEVLGIAGPGPWDQPDHWDLEPIYWRRIAGPAARRGQLELFAA